MVRKIIIDSELFLISKGQIISEVRDFGVFKSPKKQTKFFEGFLP